MRWILWGDLNERHVVASLASALRAEGDDVVFLPSETPGYVFEPTPEQAEAWTRRLEEHLPADVLFNFNPDKLSPERVRRLRDEGTTTFVWLSDDPLLYGIAYRHVVEAYDVSLHTGRADVLRFYQERHGVAGYTFPFWTDDHHFPYVWDPDAADIEVGFLGNCMGGRRGGRYELLASLPFHVRFFGRLPERSDYAGIHAGRLDMDGISRGLARFKIGVSVAQQFGKTPRRFRFDGLERFDEFWFPSRIVQYAASGIPTITVGRPSIEAPLASIVSVSTRAQVIEHAQALLDDPDALAAASRAIHAEYEACLSARSRVAMLRALLAERVPGTADERARLWRSFGTEPLPDLPLHADAERVHVHHTEPRLPDVCVLLVSRGPAGRMAAAGLDRDGRSRGLDVVWIDLDATASGDDVWPAWIDDDHPAVARLMRRVDPALVVFAGPVAPTPATAERWRAMGVRQVALATDPMPATPVDVTHELPSRSFPPAGSLIDPAPDGAGVLVRGGDDPGWRAVTHRLAHAVELRTEPPAAVELFLPGAPAPALGALAALGRGAVAVLPADVEVPLLDDTEVVRYRTRAEALAAAVYLAGRPSEREAIVAAARARIADGETWAHRWVGLCDGVVARPRRPRVAVIGYYGAGNLGDDLILEALARELPARIDVIGYRPERIPAVHGLPATALADEQRCEEVIAAADVLVIGGGGLFHDSPEYAFTRTGTVADVFASPRAGMPAFAHRAMLARAHEIPVALFALGVGPLFSDAGRTLAAWIARNAALVSVRDASSERSLREAGYGGAVSLVSDPTLLLRAPSHPDPGLPGDYVAVAHRSWPDAPEGTDERLAAMLDGVIERTGLPIVSVPFHRSSGRRDDGRAAAVVRSSMRRAEHCFEFRTGDLAAMHGAVAHARAVVGVRLHASILANAAGVPSVGISYDPKITAYYDEIGAPERALAPDFDPDAAARLVSSLVEENERHRRAVAAAMEPLRARAQAGIADLIALIEGRDAQRASPTDRQEAFARLRADLLGSAGLADAEVVPR